MCIPPKEAPPGWCSGGARCGLSCENGIESRRQRMRRRPKPGAWDSVIKFLSFNERAAALGRVSHGGACRCDERADTSVIHAQFWILRFSSLITLRSQQQHSHRSVGDRIRPDGFVATTFEAFTSLTSIGVDATGVSSVLFRWD